ncbi:cation:proton antiporter regulatory subunit [Haloplanus halobius]|uniref:cation:proton antiporter regulatory subunit n=1 Tax=Haloplanus halobius TaxID=2934938 RepID=UPI00200D4063|nr:TrkA C-terminal domain-containing protein [Haloplanus sp. XH21]
MTVRETDIPGVGRKFELDLSGDTTVTAVVHHDGRCELYRRDSADADGEKILDLSSDQANKLGSILEGAYFESVSTAELTVPLGDAIIEWVEVGRDATQAGKTLGETDLRQATGATVIAIQRGEETVPNPAAEFELAAGDLLVAVGTREEQQALRELLSPTA